VIDADRMHDRRGYDPRLRKKSSESWQKALDHLAESGGIEMTDVVFDAMILMQVGFQILSYYRLLPVERLSDNYF